MSRAEARELAMKLLFQMEAQKDFSEKAKDDFSENYAPKDGQKEYFDGVCSCFAKNREAVDALIEESSVKWHISRMDRTDLAVLRLAATELAFLHRGDVPEKAAINEAVELAKKYGGADSGRFVNGVLGALSRKLRE